MQEKEFYRVIDDEVKTKVFYSMQHHTSKELRVFNYYNFENQAIKQRNKGMTRTRTPDERKGALALKI